MNESTPHARQRQRPSAPCRRRPRLLVVLPLEETARIIVDAESYEDELRLRSYLHRSKAVEALSEIIGRLLDDLDDVGRRAA